MPRSTRYSDGCLLCIRRRVKCDERKPLCQRCERYGEECPGYRDPDEVVFRPMNISTERNALGLRRPRIRRSNTQAQEACPTAKTKLVERVLSHASAVAPPMPIDFENESLSFFIENYMLPGDDKKPGYLDFVPSLSKQADDAPYFQDALLAVSKMAMANRFRLDHLLSSARGLFGRALVGLSAALKDPETAKRDHVLATSVLCSKYEIISGEKPSLFESHNAGQNTLVRLRGSSQLDTPTGRSLFLAVTIRNHTRNLVEMSHSAGELIDVPTPPLTRSEVLSEGAELFNEALPYLVRAKELLTTSTGHVEEVLGLMSRLIELDEKLDAWKDTVPEELTSIQLQNQHSVYNVHSTPYQSTPFLQALTTYRSAEHGAFWCHYWAGRIQIMRIALLCLAYCKVCGFYNSADDSFYVQTPEKLVQLPSTVQIERSLQQFVNRICELVPYMLGRLNGATSVSLHDLYSVSRIPGTTGREALTQRPAKALGAYFLVLTLYPAGLVTCISCEQHAWIQDRLLEIGHEVGIKQGLTLRDNLRGFHEGHGCGLS